MTNPQEVAAELMGVKPSCGQCAHYTRPKRSKHGTICSTIRGSWDAKIVYFSTSSCDHFVLYPRGRMV